MSVIVDLWPIVPENVEDAAIEAHPPAIQVELDTRFVAPKRIGCIGFRWVRTERECVIDSTAPVSLGRREVEKALRRIVIRQNESGGGPGVSIRCVKRRRQ